MKFAKCQLCASPFIDAINEMLIAGGTARMVYEKYHLLLGYEAKYASFEMLVHRHRKHTEKVSIQKRIESIKNLEGVDIDTLTENLLKLGNQKISELGNNVEKLKLSDVFAGQRIMIELKKLKMQEDAMSTAMSKLFGPSSKLIKQTEVIDGQIIPEEVKTLETTTGDPPSTVIQTQPANPQ